MRGAMGEGGDTALQAALDCLDAFKSVGVRGFARSITDEHEAPLQFRRNLSHGQLRHSLPDLLPYTPQRWQNVIIRPLARENTDFIQLDDLPPDVLERVRPLSLFTLQTSPKGSQAWLVLDAPHSKDFTRRVKRAVETVDRSASGAMRIPGSRNFKEKYIPPQALDELAAARAGEDSAHEIARIKATHAAQFPLVAMPYRNDGRLVTRDELESLGLVAPPEVFTLPPGHVSPPHKQGHSRWPDYGRCLTSARHKADGTPDRSIADFNWCMTCLDPAWGGEWAVAAVAARLLEVSEKPARWSTRAGATPRQPPGTPPNGLRAGKEGAHDRRADFEPQL